MNAEELKKLLDDIDVFLLDMDGTVYLGEKPIGDMKNTLAAIRKSGRRVVYCTNNSSKTTAEYENKLVRLGLWGEGDFVYTSGMATAEYLSTEHAGRRVYLLGTDALKQDFAAAGIPLDERAPEICVLAFDPTLTYEKLRAFNEFLVKGATYIATHPDDVCPAEGVSVPDAGSFIKLFECSARRLPDLICGKPYTVMGECISRKLQTPPARILMVGDRTHTDVRFGVNNKFRTLLVLSGETTAEYAALAPDRADAVVQSLNDIVSLL